MLRDLCEHLVDIDGATLKVSEAAQLVEGLPTSPAALNQLLQNCSCLNIHCEMCIRDRCMCNCLQSCCMQLCMCVHLASNTLATPRFGLCYQTTHFHQSAVCQRVVVLHTNVFGLLCAALRRALLAAIWPYT